MRLFFFLSCSVVFCLSPNKGLSQNTKIVLDSDKKISVNELFRLIQDQTDYRFIYNLDLFENYPKVPVKKGKNKVKRLLEKSLIYGGLLGRFNLQVHH